MGSATLIFRTYLGLRFWMLEFNVVTERGLTQIPNAGSVSIYMMFSTYPSSPEAEKEIKANFRKNKTPTVLFRILSLG